MVNRGSIAAAAVILALSNSSAFAAPTLTSVVGSPSEIFVGQLANFTVEVLSNGAGSPTGNVILATGLPDESCIATLVSSGTDAATGSCSFTPSFSSIPAGIRGVVAAYNGAPGFDPSSATAQYIVNTAVTTTTHVAPPTASPQSVVSIIVNTTVDAPGGGTPSGVTEVTATGPTETRRCFVQSPATSCDIVFLAPGAYDVVAQFLGNPDHTMSMSSPTTLTVFSGFPANDCNYIGPGLGSWSNPSHWSCGVAPGANDRATINGGPEVLYDVSVGGTVGEIVIGDATLSIEQNLTIGHALRLLDGTIGIGPSTTLTVPTNSSVEILAANFSMSIEGTLTMAGTWSFQGGNANFNLGSFNVSPTGRLVVRGGPQIFDTADAGSLNIDGKLLALGDTTFNIPGADNGLLHVAAASTLRITQPRALGSLLSLKGRAGTYWFQTGATSTLLSAPERGIGLHAEGAGTRVVLPTWATPRELSRFTASANAVVDLSGSVVVLHRYGLTTSARVNGNGGVRSIAVAGNDAFFSSVGSTTYDNIHLQVYREHEVRSEQLFDAGAQLTILPSGQLTVAADSGTLDFACELPASCATTVTVGGILRLTEPNLVRLRPDIDLLVNDLFSALVNVQFGGLQVDDDVLLANGSIQILNASTLSVGGGFVQSSGELRISDSASLTTASALQQSNGSIFLDGTITGALTQTGGELQVGLAASITGAYQQGSAGVLAVPLLPMFSAEKGPTCGQARQLLAGPGLTLNGSLRVMPSSCSVANGTGPFTVVDGPAGFAQVPALIGNPNAAFALQLTGDDLLYAEQVTATCTWNVNGAGAWNVPANWNGCSTGSGTPAGTPGAADTAVVSASTPLANVALGGNRTVNNLTIEAGTIGGNGDLEVAGTLTWLGGELAGVSPSSDELILLAGATATLGGGVKTLRARSWVNSGDVLWTGGNIVVAADAQIANPGIFRASIDGLSTISGDGAPLILFDNAGTFNKLGGGLAVITANVPFQNSGQVNVIEGRLEISGGGIDSGSHNVAPGGELQFDLPVSVTRTMTGPLPISGDGFWIKSGAGSLIFTGGYAHPGPVELLGGVVEFSTTGASVELVDVLLESAQISGEDDINLTGTLLWNGGEITATLGTALFRVAVGSALNMIRQSPAQRILRNRTIEVAGAMDINETTLLLDGSARVDVIGGLNLNGSSLEAARIQCLVAPPCGAVVVQAAGILGSSSTGSNSLGAGFNLQLDGTLNVDAGQLLLESNLLSSAGSIIDIAAGATLSRSTVLVFNNGTLRGSGTIGADLDVGQVEIRPGTSPGILTVQGDFTAQPTTRFIMQASGTVAGMEYDRLTINGNVTLAGTLDALALSFTPTPTDVFDFITYSGSRSGAVALGSNDFPGFVLTNIPNAVRLAAAQSTFVVDRSDDDSSPAAQACTAALNDCTLRGAMAGAVLFGPGADIEFNIPGAGPHVITPGSALPMLPNNIRFDGNSQPGSVPNSELGFGPLNMVIQIEIDGSLTGAGTDGLVFALGGGPSRVEGIAVHSFSGAQIVGSGAPENVLFVFGNLIGLRADGTTVGSAQAVGVRSVGDVVVGDPVRAPMSRNVLAGFSEQALELTSGNALQAELNYIGTDRTGTVSFAANGRRGLYAEVSGPASTGLYLRNNVISGHDEDAVRLQCVVVGSACFDLGAAIFANRIGTSASGLSALPNGGNGVHISGLVDSQVDIGLAVGDPIGNQIRFNGGNGVLFTNAAGNVGRVAVFGPNLINSNGGLALDLAGDGRTANDAGDADIGPNDLQNFPVFSAFSINTSPDPDQVDVTLTLDTPALSAPNNYPIRIDVFVAEGDELGAYLGSGTLVPPTVDRGPIGGSFNFNIPSGVTLTDDSVLVAIATDAQGRSSELSHYATTTVIVADTPDPTFAGDPYNVTVEVVPDAPSPFTTAGALTINDGRGGSCVAPLAPLSGAGSAGTCTLTSVGAPGLITLTAAFNGSSTAFVNSSGTATHTIAGPLPTTTTIANVAPEPSIVGQPYTVTVAVTDGAMPVATGLVEVRQLTDNQTCTINLASANSCQLSSSLAITTAVQARFLGTPLLASSQSATQAHAVNPAATQITIVADTPDPSALNEPITVTTALAVVTPGAGTPTGEIFITDGVGSCSAFLPALSCSFVPKNAGVFDLQARYLGDANFLPSTDLEPHTVSASNADLAIVKRNGLRLLPGGSQVTYVILVTNNGPQPVTNARITDILPAQLSAATWTCGVNGNGSCPASGTGSIDVLVSLASGSQATFTLTAAVQLTPEQIVANTAAVQPPPNVPDPSLVNNESTDVDTIGVFGEGFESENE